MSKSIIIQENGTSKTISVDKLRTKLVGGGSGTWSPKDGAKIAPIIVRKNGTYKASALGINGISKVVVNTEATGADCEVTGTAKVGNIKAINVAIAEGEIARLFSTNTITTKLSGGGKCEWVPDDSVKLKTKSIKANGTFNPSDDKCYGYSQVTVNVPHKSDGSDKYPYVPDDPYVPSDPSHPDSPSYIKVTKEPNKTTYDTGDTIYYTGIECTMYNLDGSVFTDAEHPNGILVESELTFPVTEAPEPEETTPDENIDIPDLNEG